MRRALRVIAVIALACLALFFVLTRLPLNSGARGSGSPDALDLLLPALPAILVNLVGNTTDALCLGVGVVALVAAIQRRQWGWAVVFVALLLITANGGYLILELAPLLAADGQSFAFMPYGVLLLNAVAPLATLVYTFFPYSRVTPDAATLGSSSPQ